MDALSTELVNVPARHRSLRATIDHTWSLLEPAEQELFASLGVFHGGFTEAAAMQVANTNAAQIQALADHFLVRQAGGGRYYLHESLRQYAAEKLALDPAREQDIRNRHSEATLGRLAACEEQLDSPDQPRILAELAPDQDNIRQAWIHAVQSNHQEVLNHSLQAVYLFHDLRSDPFQQRNLARTGEQGETAAALRDALLAWNRATPWMSGSLGGTYGDGRDC